MSRIGGKNTRPEKIVRSFLFSSGFRYRIHDTSLPGKPDIVLKKYNTVIFINGCFWHGHKGCKYFRFPKSNVSYWTLKIKQNILRDRKNIKLLRELNWNVIVVWECQLRSVNQVKSLRRLVNKILD